MHIVLIAAISENRVLGKNNELPWSLPADEAHLRAQIQQGWLLTGRKSFETPQGNQLFADRSDVLVLTNRLNYAPSGVQVVHGLEAAFAKAEAAGAERLNVLGGAKVYDQTLPFADELILTEVHTVIDGDAYFPEIPRTVWEEVRREDHPADADNPYPYSFVWYRKKPVVS